MLDGRQVIEVPWGSDVGTRGNALRVWVTRFPGKDERFVIAQAAKTVDGKAWVVLAGFSTVERLPTLREVRRFLFRGNGRLTGGHPEITDAVTAPMSRANVMALCMPRTVPGHGDYWD
jgi:hypothetical protein